MARGGSRHQRGATTAGIAPPPSAATTTTTTAGRFYKAYQRGCYTFLNSSLGAAIVLGATLVLLIIAVQLVDTSSYGTGYLCVDSVVSSSPLLEEALRTRGGSGGEEGCNVNYADNIAAKSFETTLCDEPLDAVYTWVNGSELEHQSEVAFWQMLQQREFHTADDWIAPAAEAPGTLLGGGEEATTAPTPSMGESAATTTTTAAPSLSAQQLDDQSSRSRFEDHDELRYSLRSLEKYAGWVRRVYLVTNGQIPTWLNTSHPRITIVPHSTIFPNKSHLPTFSSPAIESHLHRIPGLSRRFLYLNDDTLFGAPVAPSDFYSRLKGHRLYYSWPVPQCAEGCPAAWLGDGTCDRQCNTSSCDYDSGDCIGPNVRVLGNQGGTNGHAAVPSSRGQGPKQSTTFCNGNCADGWIGDRYCDAACNHRDCAFDGGDCGLVPYENDEHFLQFHIRGTALQQRQLLRPSNKTTIRSSSNRLVIHHHFIVDISEQKAFLVNFSHVLPFTVTTGGGSTTSSETANTAHEPQWTSRITSGEFDTPSWIRAATISQAHKTLFVSVVGEWGKFSRTTQFIVEGERSFKSRSTTHTGPQLIRILFNVTLTNRSSLASDDKDVPPHHRTTHTVSWRAPLLLEDAEVVGDSDTATTSTTSKAPVAGSPLPTIVVASNENEEEDSSTTTQRRLMQAANEDAEQATAWTAALSAFPPEAPPYSEDDKNDKDDGGLKTSTQRRLLDLFGDSLKHTNMLLNRKFKSTSRRVPAHMVHLIDRDVMSELWKMWPAEWEATSSSKFRTRSNLQYAFMNYYWMVHAEKKSSKLEVFDKMVDVDGSGYVERREMRRIALLLWEKEVALGPLDTIAKDIVAGCEIVLNQQHQQQPQYPSGSNNEETHSSTSSHVLPAENDVSTTSSAPPPVVMPLGEDRDVVVCEALMQLPTTEVFVKMIHPPPPPPPPTTEAPAADSSHLSTVHSLTNNHSSRWRRTNHSRRENPSAASLAPPQVASNVASNNAARQSPPTPPAFKPYKPPVLNPEEKIRPLTKEYLATVEWLVRVAALGVTVGGEGKPSRQLSHAILLQNQRASHHDDARDDACIVPLPYLDDDAMRGGDPATTETYREDLQRAVRIVMQPHCWVSSHQPPSVLENRVAVVDPVPITRDTFAHSHIGAIVSEKFSTAKRYRVSIEELEDVTFVMVRNNATIVRHQMDHVLYKRPKFLCINDDMNHTSEAYGEVLSIVEDMFQSYYPVPSSFELRGGERNPFTRLKEAASGGEFDSNADDEDAHDSAKPKLTVEVQFRESLHPRHLLPARWSGDAPRLVVSAICFAFALVLLRALGAVRLQ